MNPLWFAVYFALLTIIIIIWFWPDDAKLNKIRREDYHSDAEYLAACDKREQENR